MTFKVPPPFTWRIHYTTGLGKKVKDTYQIVQISQLEVTIGDFKLSNLLFILPLLECNQKSRTDEYRGIGSSGNAYNESQGEVFGRRTTEEVKNDKGK